VRRSSIELLAPRAPRARAGAERQDEEQLRMSYGLSNESARAITCERQKQRETQLCARQAVTSTVRGGRAHVMELLNRVLGLHALRSDRSSAARSRDGPHVSVG